MKYRKKPIPHSVSFAKAAGTLQTLEGPVDYASGDALMTGVAEEHWPISRPRFEATYTPVPPTVMGENGLYLKMPIPVSAYQAHDNEMISLGDGRGELRAKPGDWIVTSPDGKQWVVADSIFHDTYEPIPS